MAQFFITYVFLSFPRCKYFSCLFTDHELNYVRIKFTG